MRLASKIFLTTTLVIAVLAGVGALSLRAVDRLVTVNREITTVTVPALRLAASAREAISALTRLEARTLVLRDGRYDGRYVAAWRERAVLVARDLERLAYYATRGAEAARLQEARVAFDAYRRVFDEEQRLVTQGERERAMQLADTDSLTYSGWVEARLDELMDAIHAGGLAAQAEAARLEARTWTAVLISLGAAVLLALLGSGLVAYRMTHSLETLSAATADVAGGSFREPLPVESADEIGQLARSFNWMAAQLRQMEETKDEFFATVSHELRSPLTSIRGATDLLRDGVPGPLTEKQTRLVEIISGSSDRLLQLVNQILEISRLRAGLVPLDRTWVELDRLVAHAVEELPPRAEAAGVRLERERIGTDFRCHGDEGRLLQVVVNLAANAIRFTPKGGRVVVRLVDADTELELQVEDTGVGIPAAELPHIFEPYRQAHRDRGGTGLGLATVRGVARAHGGRVTVESQEGKGSRFTVLLPRA
jgi:signal transduction histidine kinase